MSISIAVRLQAWSAWAPGLPDRVHWQRWLAEKNQPEVLAQRPACKTIPAMLRRRCTLNTRMALESALAVCDESGVDPKQVRLFLGTANGEISALQRLLHDLADDQPLSPTSFTNSVHHVPTGYFSIATQHMGLSRTVSAYTDTFTCTFLDMLGLLTRKQDKPALLVIADEIPGGPFDKMLAVQPFPFAVAMLFEPCRPGTPSSISLARDLNRETEEKSAGGDPLFNFLSWVDSGLPRLRLDTSFGAVVWQRH